MCSVEKLEPFPESFIQRPIPSSPIREGEDLVNFADRSHFYSIWARRHHLSDVKVSLLTTEHQGI